MFTTSFSQIAGTRGQLVRNGVYVEIRIAGRVLGRVQSVRLFENFNQIPVKELGSCRVVEFVPGIADGQAQLTKVMIKRLNFKRIMGQSSICIRELSEFSVAATDREDGATLFTLIGCAWQTYTRTCSVGNVLFMEDVSIGYCDVQEE